MPRSRRAWLALPVLLPVLLAASGRARGESVGDLLPVAIPGFGAAPGVSAASRLHPDYLPRPLSPGPGSALQLFPSIGVEAGIDTAPGAGIGATALGVLRPGLRVIDPVLGLAGVASGTIERDARDPAADSNQVTVALGWRMPLGPGRLTLGAAHVTRTETALGLAAGGGAAGLDVATDDARMAYRLGFGAFSVTQRVEIGADRVTSRGAIPAGFGRRALLRSETVIASDPGAPLRALALLRVGSTHYAGALPGGGFVDSTGLGLLAGVASDPRAVWAVRLVAGAERERFAAGGPEPALVAIWNAALAWTPDPLVSARLELARQAGPDTGLGTPGTAVTTERLDLAEAYARNLLLTASLTARQGRVAGHGATETDIAAGATWHLSRSFALAPSASLALRHGLDGAAPREARITLALEWSP